MAKRTLSEPTRSSTGPPRRVLQRAQTQPRGSPPALARIAGRRTDEGPEQQRHPEQLGAEGLVALRRDQADDRDDQRPDQQRHGLQRPLGQALQPQDAVEVDREGDEHEAGERRRRTRAGDEEVVPLGRVVGGHSGSRDVLAAARVDPDRFALLDEQRDLDDDAGLERRRLAAAAGGGVAFDPGSVWVTFMSIALGTWTSLGRSSTKRTSTSALGSTQRIASPSASVGISICS